MWLNSGNWAEPLKDEPGCQRGIKPEVSPQAGHQGLQENLGFYSQTSKWGTAPRLSLN